MCSYNQIIFISYCTFWKLFFAYYSLSNFLDTGNKYYYCFDIRTLLCEKNLTPRQQFFYTPWHACRN